jgi:hypothetical protein
MVIKDAGSTTHFLFKYDGSVNGAPQRASALMLSCENDLTRLEDLFDEHNGFDSGNPVTVLVSAGPSGGLVLQL